MKQTFTFTLYIDRLIINNITVLKPKYYKAKEKCNYRNKYMMALVHCGLLIESNNVHMYFLMCICLCVCLYAFVPVF